MFNYIRRKFYCYFRDDKKWFYFNDKNCRGVKNVSLSQNSQQLNYRNLLLQFYCWEKHTFRISWMKKTNIFLSKDDDTNHIKLWLIHWIMCDILVEDQESSSSRNKLWFIVCNFFFFLLLFTKCFYLLMKIIQLISLHFIPTQHASH